MCSDGDRELSGTDRKPAERERPPPLAAGGPECLLRVLGSGLGEPGVESLQSATSCGYTTLRGNTMLMQQQQFIYHYKFSGSKKRK